MLFNKRFGTTLPHPDKRHSWNTCFFTAYTMAKDSLASKTSSSSSLSSSWLGYAAVGVFAYLLGIITTSPSTMTLSATLFGHPEDEEDYYYEESSEYSHPISRFLMKPEVTHYSVGGRIILAFCWDGFCLSLTHTIYAQRSSLL